MAKRTWRTVTCAFILTVTVLLFPFGCLKAELATRTALGTPLALDAAAVHRRTETLTDTLAERLPPRLAGVVWLVRAEKALMERWL